MNCAASILFAFLFGPGPVNQSISRRMAVNLRLRRHPRRCRRLFLCILVSFPLFAYFLVKMGFGRFLPAILAASSLSHARDDGLKPNVQVAKSRGPQIFNAVHDSMRQWGESLHHNGMSFYLATVPEGVIFHHGNNAETSPDEPDWLAYEVEHAENFARGRFGGPGRGGPGHGGPPPGGPPPVKARGELQSPLGPVPDAEDPPAESKGGWLHTYRTSRTLRYLYVDGMSGGKTTMGTLDSQDFLLRGTRVINDFEPKESRSHEKRAGGGGPMDERLRAVELCALSKDWNLSGIIRMEAGFEIIHCDFSDGLEQIQALQRPGSGEGRGGGAGRFEGLRGLTERYHDIGSSRTIIDFSSMVSAFFFPVNLTNPDAERPDLPRLVSTTDGELAAIQAYLNQTIKARHDDAIPSIDWQDVTDIIVGRYSDRIQYMAQKAATTDDIASVLDFLLTVYVDYSGKDSPSQQIPAAIDRCTNFYLHAIAPATKADELIHAAFQSVTSTICTKLFEVRQLIAGAVDEDEEELMEQTVGIIKDLAQELSWARFKRCSGCAINEVCLVPMWPMGTKADYDSPRCVNASDTRGGGEEGYWGHFGGPGGPGGGRGGKGGPGSH